MRLWLRNSAWHLYVMPRREATGRVLWSWGLYGSQREDPLLEQATFGLEYRRGRRRWHRPLAGGMLEHQALDDRRGHGRWMADDSGLQPRLEMDLHPHLPLVRWRLHWEHAGSRPVQVARVVLLEVGPLRPLTSSRHRWGLGFIPAGFLRMRRPGWDESGALRLHPSPGRLTVLGPPWPWEETLAEYSAEERPYRPPRDARAGRSPRAVPRPQAPTHAFTTTWAALWDTDHHRVLLVGVGPSGAGRALVEVRMEPLHPALRLWYEPEPERWEPGHREVSPWAALAFLDAAWLEEGLAAFAQAVGLPADPAMVHLGRRLARGPMPG